MTTFNELLRFLPESLFFRLKNVEYLHGIMDSHYCYPERHYHNYDHLIHMMAQAKDVFGDEITIPDYFDDLFVAILFHDAVYNLRSMPGENEKASAELAYRHGKQCFDDINWMRVESTIVVGTSHIDDLTNAMPIVKLVSDLDLSTFGTTFDEFHKVGQAVIAEYTELFPTRLVFEGRIAFLEKFKQRPTIFYTKHFDNSLALQNIDLEIEAIKHQLSGLSEK